MDFYTELKLKNNIHTVASILGYNGKKSGNCYQGDCPKHGSKDGKCLVLWSGFQGFKCYHCGATGDVIKLVEIFKRIDHKEAVKFLADRVGMPLWEGKKLTPEEVAQREGDAEERLLVESMLTEASEWYHDQLKNFPDIMDHLTNHYGFSQDIVEQLRIGFAPPGTSHPSITSDLANHLNKFPQFKGKLVLSGLFSFKTPSGPLWDYFQGRIIFPYWKGGKVVYMAGRATKHTPISPENPTPPKYTKLRTHKADDEKRKHISKFIQNDSFMGEDEVRGEKEIIITEGAPDWVSAIDKGFAAVSPVTTNFREQDNEKLVQLTAGAEAIYIINDNEVNMAGLKGALNTGKFSTKEKRNVFIVQLPRPQGTDKIDLNEYFLKNTADDLRKVMKDSKSLLEILIDGLPGDFIKAQPVIKEDLAPILIELDEAKYEHYFGIIRKKTKTNQKALEADMDAARNAKREALAKKEEKKVDPEVEKCAQEIAMDPLLFKKRIDVVNEAGVVGERGVIAMYLCALDSRLLPDDPISPNVLAIKNAGHFGAGKSYTLTTCLQIYPNSSFYQMTNGSAKSIFFLEGGLKHKALIVTEGFQFQANNAADSELVYAIRSLLSEGRLNYSVVEKDDKGQFRTMDRKLQGPTSFITTTVMESLEAQFEDRLFTIHPDESSEQTKAVNLRIAGQKDGTFKGLDQKTIDSWKFFHSSLKPVEVIIPYARNIMEFINKNITIPIATRRASKRVMTVIQTIACAYQNQRQKDNQGRIIADMGDYCMALQIVQDAFRENMGAQDKKTEKFLNALQEKGIMTPGSLAKMFGLKHLSNWPQKNVTAGRVKWCREDGTYFKDDYELDKAKHSGKAFLKISENYKQETITGLPTPYDISGDPKWDVGGELLKMYDLGLEQRTAVRSVLGVNEVLDTASNTPEEKEIVENVEESRTGDDGVRVLDGNSGKEGNILEQNREDAWGSQTETDDNDDDDETQDANSKGTISSTTPDDFGDEYKFNDPDPEPKKRKSQLEQLGFQKPEKKDLTEEETREREKLASEFSSFLTPKKSEDLWKGLDSESAF